LQKICSNIAVNPNSTFSKTVPKTDDAFEGTLKDCPYTEVILSDLGFRNEEQVYVLTEPNPSMALKFEEELGQLIEQELCKTSIFLAVKDVQSRNDNRDAVRVVKLLSKSFQNVLKDPQATKYHRLLLRKLLGQQLKGGLRLLSALELKINTENETVEFPYPFPRGLLRVQHIYSVFEMCAQNLGLQSEAKGFSTLD
jgi:hypothetical protein